MKLILTLIIQFVDWLENLFKREYGIRSLYMMILLIPSICFLIMYRLEHVKNKELETLLELSRSREIDCIQKTASIKREVREEVYEELKDIYKTFKDFRTDVLNENSQTVKNLKKVEDEIQQIQNKSEV